MFIASLINLPACFLGRHKDDFIFKFWFTYNLIVFGLGNAQMLELILESLHVMFDLNFTSTGLFDSDFHL